MPTQHYQKPIERDQQLKSMGLSHAVLAEAFEYGAREHATCTDNDPPGAANTMVYFRTTRRLRELLGVYGWEKCNQDNQASVVNRDLGLRIVVTTFDDALGNPDKQPKNRNEKRSAAEKRVRCNKTGWLPGLPAPQLEDVSKDSLQTWILAVHVGEEDVKAELLLPLNCLGGIYCEFDSRIYLTGPSSEPFGEEAESASGPDDGFPEIEIDVSPL
ncbi:MAG: hypothetical protein KJ871_09325 [Alphaproteobacteria bacterium]|nr:hypothetical protein [Alphaproteobacteria bacterium]MBU2082748.1 hypothetical protein [Alphaproteobacteria bacterium]MBU2143361.1 hypothetical protein [Alphaproteobacteria bacterium]MBU2196802.1 hypothetical protein [Alphaproteobacteria bacterium]